MKDVADFCSALSCRLAQVQRSLIGGGPCLLHLQTPQNIVSFLGKSSCLIGSMTRSEQSSHFYSLQSERGGPFDPFQFLGNSSELQTSQPSSCNVSVMYFPYSNIFFCFDQLKNRGMANFCFDYNPSNEHEITGHRVILYPCHGMGQNQVRFIVFMFILTDAVVLT